MEGIISMVRTAAPLTSDKTISKINTYLPPIELISTLLGMYSFLNKAQNFSPIRPLNAKTPMEKVSALIVNGNLPVGKLIAQPLIANNMDKIIPLIAKGALGSGNINDLISSMAGQYSKGQGNSDNNTDLSSLMETFMPLINNMMSTQSTNDNYDNDENIEFNEQNLYEEDKENDNIEVDVKSDTRNEHMEFDENNIVNNNNKTNTSSKIIQPQNTPIRIRQRRRR